MIDVILRGGLSDDEHVMIPPKAQKPPLHKSGALAMRRSPRGGKKGSAEQNSIAPNLVSTAHFEVLLKLPF